MHFIRIFIIQFCLLALLISSSCLAANYSLNITPNLFAASGSYYDRYFYLDVAQCNDHDQKYCVDHQEIGPLFGQDSEGFWEQNNGLGQNIVISLPNREGYHLSISVIKHESAQPTSFQPLTCEDKRTNKAAPAIFVTLKYYEQKSAGLVSCMFSEATPSTSTPSQ